MKTRNVQVVLIIDEWISSVSKPAPKLLAVPIDRRTLWDSYTGALAMLEAIVTREAEMNWEKTKARVEEWDSVRLGFGENNDHH